MSCRVSGDIVVVGPMPPPPSGQAVSFAMFADFVQSNYDGVKVKTSLVMLILNLLRVSVLSLGL